MKRSISLIVALVLALSLLGGCAQTPAADTPEPAPEAGGVEVALIVNPGAAIDDKSFIQGSWEGVKLFCDKEGMSYQYYTITDETESAYLECFDLAIAAGAKILICPSQNFSSTLYKAQDMYPDVYFVQIDGYPNDGTNFKTANNTCGIVYYEEQVGFLAGYASVMDGYRKLGFLGGMAQGAVIRYGVGFIQGVEYAASELGLGEGETEVVYSYTGNWSATPENQSKAASWYESGTEVIFACGGAVGSSVFAAAESSGAKAIGVDVDQSSESETIITSATKDLTHTVEHILGLYKDGKFPGGEDLTYGVNENGVNLPIQTSRFTTFSADDYAAIYQKLVDNTDGIRDGIGGDEDYPTADLVPTVITTVKVVE